MILTVSHGSGKTDEALAVSELDAWFGHVTVGVSKLLSVLAFELDHTRLVSEGKIRNSDSPGFFSPYPYACPAFLALAIDSALVKGDSRLDGSPATGADIVAMAATGLVACEDLEELLEPLGYSVQRREIDVPFGASTRFLELGLRAKRAQPAFWDHFVVICLAADPVGREMIGTESVAALLASRGKWMATHPQRALLEGYLSRTAGEERRRDRAKSGSRKTTDERRRDLRARFGLDIPGAVETRLLKTVPLMPEAAAAAAKTLSRHTVDPRWLIYLPPAMTCIQSTAAGEPLEHPRTAMEYYRAQGVRKVLIEAKHTGSRAIVVMCRDEVAAARAFGEGAAGLGCVYTRNGRAFFRETALEIRFLEALSDALDAASFWDRFKTDWACLDGELMPWSLKAGELLDELGPGVLAAGKATIAATRRWFGERVPPFLEAALTSRERALAAYEKNLRRYFDAGNVDSPIQFAPFHLLATERDVHMWKPHRWHLDAMRGLARAAPGFLVPTFALATDLNDASKATRVGDWWERLCSEGVEGAVVKPWYFVTHGRQGLVQPALKCRTPEHLRSVYGLEYDSPKNRITLAARPGLQNRRHKHRRIVRQFALSLEGLERFVSGEGPARTLECVLGVLALDSGGLT